MRFHRRCGDRVTLLNDNSTAVRNFVEFNHGLILSAEPLKDDVMFEVCIDRKVSDSLFSSFIFSKPCFFVIVADHHIMFAGLVIMLHDYYKLRLKTFITVLVVVVLAGMSYF